MNVSSYLFQTPYSQAFQVGKPDPSMVQEQSKEKMEDEQKKQQKSNEISSVQQNYNSEEMGIKSSVLYAKSDGFALSSDTISKLSDASKNVNQNEYLKIYAQNDILN